MQLKTKTHSTLVQAAHLHLAHRAGLLNPAEALLHQPAAVQADRVAFVPGRPAVDFGAAALVALGDMRRDVCFACGFESFLGVAGGVDQLFVLPARARPVRHVEDLGSSTPGRKRRREREADRNEAEHDTRQNCVPMQKFPQRIVGETGPEGICRPRRMPTQ